MADKKMNVLQKLAEARVRFLEAGTKKSGKNIKLEFSYFELEDIVPVATKIFHEIGLVSIVSFENDYAIMRIRDVDDMESDPVVFVVPYREIDPIVSKQGNQVTNAVQITGMSITYFRRYLYMMALDIVEADAIDANLGSTPVEEEEKPKKAPATKTERKAAKKKLTEEEASPASEEAVTGLKALCKKLIEADEEQKGFVEEIAEKTEGFTNMTEPICEALIAKLKEILHEYE